MYQYHTLNITYIYYYFINFYKNFNYFCNNKLDYKIINNKIFKIMEKYAVKKNYKL